MTEFIIQFIRETLIVIPGASIRWILLNRRKSFSEILDEESPYNYVLSIAFLLVLVMIIVKLKN